MKITINKEKRDPQPNQYEVPRGAFFKFNGGQGVYVQLQHFSRGQGNGVNYMKLDTGRRYTEVDDENSARAVTLLHIEEVTFVEVEQ